MQTDSPFHGSNKFLTLKLSSAGGFVERQWLEPCLELGNKFRNFHRDRQRMDLVGMSY